MKVNTPEKNNLQNTQKQSGVKPPSVKKSVKNTPQQPTNTKRNFIQQAGILKFCINSDFIAYFNQTLVFLDKICFIF